MTSRVKVVGLVPVMRAIDIFSDLRKFGDVPMTESLEFIQFEVEQYPAKDHGAFASLATPGQKRAYWTKVSKGLIQHGSSGYIRSNKLKDGWEDESEIKSSSAKGSVFNEEDHARYVHGSGRPGRQSFHKRSGWRTDEEFAEDFDDEITRIWQREYDFQARKI